MNHATEGGLQFRPDPEVLRLLGGEPQVLLHVAARTADLRRHRRPLALPSGLPRPLPEGVQDTDRRAIGPHLGPAAVTRLEAGMRTFIMVLALTSLPLRAGLSAQQAPVGLGLTSTAPLAHPQPGIAAPGAAATRRTRALEGAIIGFVVGAAATVVVTRSGGSTAPCNRSANQDAMSSGECLALAAAGGLVGAGLGALIGSRVRVSARQVLPPPRPGAGAFHGRLVVAAVSIGAPRAYE
jgi:hypothetical protein